MSATAYTNHQPHHCLLNRLFRSRSKKPSKLRVTGLCVGNSLVTGEFPAQRASNSENASIWWRHHGTRYHGIRLYLLLYVCLLQCNVWCHRIILMRWQIGSCGIIVFPSSGWFHYLVCQLVTCLSEAIDKRRHLIDEVVLYAVYILFYPMIFAR